MSQPALSRLEAGRTVPTIPVLERIALDTGYVGTLIRYRVTGFLNEAFAPAPHNMSRIDPLALLTPGRFFSSPGLWLGMVFAVVFVAAAIWLRRGREPM